MGDRSLGIGRRGTMGAANTLQATACNCIGPQNGDPVCPCMMPEHRRRVDAERAFDLLIKANRALHEIAREYDGARCREIARKALEP